MIFLRIIMLVLFIFFAFNVLYIAVFAVAGRLRRKTDYLPEVPKNNIAILIPSYGEDNVILHTALEAGRHDYDGDRFDVFVIADHLKPETVDALSKIEKVTVFPVNFAKSTKARSLHYALERVPAGKYQIVFILDADNIMGPGCLEKVNSAFRKGFRMVQLHRCAKNTNTPTAVLDAMSEEINNHIFRQGHRALGLSSALIGSGMAFDFNVFKQILNETDIVNNPGEDSEINMEMLRRGFVCEYIEDALVFDEKVQSEAVLEVQRTRWISSQIRYAREYWIQGFLKTMSSGIHYFELAIQTLILPRVLLLLALFLAVAAGLVFHFVFGAVFFPSLSLWSTLLLLYLFSLLISIWGRLPLSKILKASFSLPLTVLSVLKALFKSKGNHAEFIRTPKEFTRNEQQH